MKLLTINTHSIIEPDYENKLKLFVDSIYRLRPDVIAMQEVNQRIDNLFIASHNEFNIRSDNHGMRVKELLLEKGLDYNCIWQGIKMGYDRYEEGVAIMTPHRVLDIRHFPISCTDDRTDWRRRMALGVKISDEWFYSVHMGRYDDETDPFSEQWKKFCTQIDATERVWVMGDFNCDALTQGYNEVVESGWYDTHSLAREKDSGITVKGSIDGWHDKAAADMRIDYIFTNTPTDILSSKVIFNGINEPVISDHYGVEVVF